MYLFLRSILSTCSRIEGDSSVPFISERTFEFIPGIQWELDFLKGLRNGFSEELFSFLLIAFKFSF